MATDQSRQLADALRSPEAPAMFAGLLKRVQGIQANIEEGYKSRETGDDAIAKEQLSRLENTGDIPLVIRATGAALKTSGEFDTVLRAAVDVMCEKHAEYANQKKQRKKAAEEESLKKDAVIHEMYDELKKERDSLSAERTRCAMICEVLSVEREKISEERRQLSTDRALTISYIGKLKELDKERKQMAEERRKELEVAASKKVKLDEDLKMAAMIEQKNLKNLIVQDRADRQASIAEMKKELAPLKDIAEKISHLQQSFAHARMQIASSAVRSSVNGIEDVEKKHNESSPKQQNVNVQSRKQNSTRRRRNSKNAAATTRSPPIVAVPGNLIEFEEPAEFEPSSPPKSTKSTPRRKSRKEGASASTSKTTSRTTINGNSNSTPKNKKEEEVTERALVLHGSRKPRRRLSEIQKLQASLATAQWVDSRQVAKIKIEGEDNENGNGNSSWTTPPHGTESTRKRGRTSITASEDGRKKKKK